MWNIIWDIGFIVINHNGIYTHCWPLHSSLADKSLKVKVRWYNVPIIGGKDIIFAVSSKGGTYCEQDDRSSIKWLGLVQWRCNNCTGKKEWFDHVEGAKKGYKDAKITLVQIAKKGNDK